MVGEGDAGVGNTGRDLRLGTLLTEMCAPGLRGRSTIHLTDKMTVRPPKYLTGNHMEKAGQIHFPGRLPLLHPQSRWALDSH